MDKMQKDFYYRCSPYCFLKMPNGRYLALNREYLPIDRSRKDVGGYLEQSDYDFLLEESNKEIGIILTAKDIALLKCDGDKDRFWLYRDKKAPWSSQRDKISYDKKINLVPLVKWVA